MVAYICDGLVPKCSGKVGCYKCPGAAFDDKNMCHHTTDISHAVNGPSENPEQEVLKRFVRYVADDNEISYFELPVS